MENEFNISDPEFVGAFPVRQDMPITPNKLDAGWTVTEEFGIEVFKPHEGWIDEFGSAVANEGCYSRLINKYAIKDKRGLKVGDKIIVSSLIGLEEATVKEIDYEANKASSESRCNVYPLEFIRDAWVCGSCFNKELFKTPNGNKKIKNIS